MAMSHDNIFGPIVAVTKVHVDLSNLRNSHVTLSVLGVKAAQRGSINREEGATSVPGVKGD